MGERESSHLRGEKLHTNALFMSGHAVKNILYILIPYSGGSTSDVLMSLMELSSLYQICEQDLLNVI